MKMLQYPSRARRLWGEGWLGARELTGFTEALAAPKGLGSFGVKGLVSAQLKISGSTCSPALVTAVLWAVQLTLNDTEEFCCSDTGENRNARFVVAL